MNRFWENLDKTSAMMSPVFPDTEDPSQWVEISIEEAVKYFGEGIIPTPPPPPAPSYDNETLTAALLALTQDL